MKNLNLAAMAAQGYNRVPQVRLVAADLETPLSCYLKLAQGSYSYLLESAQGGEKWGRYSIIGLPAQKVLRIYGHRADLEENGHIVSSEQIADPLAYVETFQAQYNAAPLTDLPAFYGGLVGYFSYDTVRYVEPRLAASCPEDTLGVPDIMLMVSEDVVVFDNMAGAMFLITHVDPQLDNAEQLAQSQLDVMEEKLALPVPKLPPLAVEENDEAASIETQFESGFSQPEYEAAVEKVREYVHAGDVMQVVPSRRMSIPFTAPPVNLYRSLRRLNPSPYMYFLNMGDFHIVGSSPEILARLEDNEVTVRPIAGTRKRGKTQQEDDALEAEMLADPKEIAEHLMLIDLGRNDVGRVANTGSVVLSDKMIVERYSHVMHIVSHVTGQLKSGLNAMDVLRATLPAGTLSGAPKIRAMEIIDELEPVKRGVYGGAVGDLGWGGNMDTAIAIRTAVIKDGVLNVQSGGGVVADSIPALEWKETMNKARAMFRAVAMAKGEGE